jgi:imidazolonepropionase-like amidohydrolase
MKYGKSKSISVEKLIIGNGKIINNAKIGIKKGIITEVTTESLKENYDELHDLSDKNAMPGLIDAHVHIKYSGTPDPVEYSDEYLAIRGVELARKALMSGVTSLADAGAVRNVAFAVRNTINDGVTLGPRVFASGEMITITGGRSQRPGYRMEVDGEDSARKAARQLLLYYGADFIKLGATGAISSPHTGPRHPQLTVEEMMAAVEEAHNCAKKVHTHCYGEQGISNSLEAGVDVIVHGQTLTKQHIKIMKESGTMLLPTLKTYWGHYEHWVKTGIPERTVTTGIWDETETNFKNVLKNNIPFAMGTDSGMTDNFFGDNPKDLEYMVEWGATPSQAILAGTLNAARTIGIEEKLGTIEAGKLADLLILDKDPLEDITAIRKSLNNIVLNGRFLK